MKPLRHPSRLGDEAGAISPIAAVTLAAVLGLGGLVTDVGVWYVQRRSLQSATDLAAMAAANHPAQAAAVAADFLSRNGYAAANLVSAQAGWYCPDAALAPEARFSLGPCATGAVTPVEPNAVRVVARTGGPLFLSRVLGGVSEASIRTTATAARIDEAGLKVGSGLVSADLPLVNGVLGSLVGGSGLALTAAQFDGLLDTNLEALAFFDALAARLNVKAGTYGQLLHTQAKVGEVLDAAVAVLDQQDQVADVSAAVAGLQAIRSAVTGDPTVSLGDLFNLGVWQDEPVGGSTAPAALKAGLNAYQLAVLTLQLGDGSHAVAIPTASLGIPGLLGATLETTAIEPPQGGYFAFGPEGVSVHTAQVRLKLKLQATSLLQLPLYVEVAQGDAQLTGLECGADPAVDTRATVRASSGVATLYLGEPPANVMTNFSQPVSYSDLASTPIVNLNILGLGAVQVKGKAYAPVASSGETELTFLQADAAGPPSGASLTTTGYIARPASGGLAATDGWPAEVVSSNVAGGVGQGLLGNLDLTACVLNCTLQVNVGPAITGPVLSLLNPLLSGIDPLVDGILETMGVKLGRAEIWVSGVRCGVPVLVT